MHAVLGVNTDAGRYVRGVLFEYGRWYVWTGQYMQIDAI